MGHTPGEPTPPPVLLDLATAEHLATTLQALAAPSRLRILSHRDPVGVPAAGAGMPSTLSAARSSAGGASRTHSD
jgi:hypothetical protein